MKKFLNLFLMAVLFTAPSLSQTGDLEEVLNWLETECAEDTTGLAEYCELLELAIACGEGDTLACIELEAGVDEILNNGGEEGDEEEGDGDGENDGEEGDDDEYDDEDVEQWLMDLEAECAEDSTSLACEILGLALSCLDGDSSSCEELEALLDEMEDSEDEEDGEDDGEEGEDDEEEGDCDDCGDNEEEEDEEEEDEEDGEDDGEEGEDEEGDDDGEEGDDDDDEEGEDDGEEGDDDNSDASCNAFFEVTQALTEDSMPIAGSVWIYIFDYDENLSYAWDFGDEGTSSDPFPTWTYNTDGPYTICLTVSDPLGSCTDVYCESISVDSLGMIGGFMSGFTINVLDGGASSGTPANVNETTIVFDGMTVYPNPTAEDFVRIRWNAQQNGVTVATLYDLRGTRVVEKQTTSWTGENQVELNIAHLERGYYLVQLAMGDLRMTQRLIIQ